MKKYLVLIIIFLGSQLYAQENNSHLAATIIGSGSPKYNAERSGSSVLISYKNTKILVDMGNGTQANIHKLNVKIKDIDGLLFTHHHLDHNEEFTPIFIQSLLGGNNIIVAGPKPTTTMVDNILTTYGEDITYRLSKSGRSLSDVKSNFTAKNLTGNTPFYIGDIKITYTPVKHSIATFAYRFDAGNESIVISGDLTYSETLPILANNADYLIMDSGGAIELGKKRNSNTNKNNTGNKQQAHVNLAESSQMAKEANVKNLVLTHFNFTNVDEIATSAEIQKNYSGTIIYGEDLMTLPLKQNSTTNKNSNLKYSYPIVDTRVQDFYSDTKEISKPSIGAPFYGQDANYNGNQSSYTNNGDGTIVDHVTGLMWEQDMGTKMTLEEAIQKAKDAKLGGYNDWRVPTIKELYSLIQFTGKVKGATAIELFIDTDYFNQTLGNSKNGEREIDAQTWSSTEYVGRTMKNDETIFGVNFVDGRIKGYPKYKPKTGANNKMYFRLVRGNTDYGKNNFIDNGDGTVSDYATGLMWQKTDDGIGKDWEEALTYAENLKLAEHSDWRLPNAKELQSIVDYTRSPQTTNSPAIHPVFEATQIKDPEGNSGQYPFYWTSTTHLDGRNPYASAVYIAFGEGLGKMNGTLMDVHGAGCQRSDPKSGDKEDYPEYFGPQGDVRYVYNYVRSVRDIKSTVNFDVIEQSYQQPKKNQKAQQTKQRETKSSNYISQYANVPEGGVVTRGKLPDLNAFSENGDPLKLMELSKGKYTVLAMGCLTCPEFHKAYTGIEALNVDYTPKDVQFFFVYKSLRHPELDGYVEAQNISERLLMIKEVKKKLGTKVPWIADAIDDNIRMALNAGSQSVYLIDPEGNIVKGWGKLKEEELRQALSDRVGAASTLTTAKDLDLAVIKRYEKRPNEDTNVTIHRPEGLNILAVEPKNPEDTYYVKLRAEADRDLLETGNGKLALGFFPDPILDAHWNNLTPQMKYVLELPEGVTASPQEANAERGSGDSDTEPRQFWVSIKGAKPSDKIELTLHYYGCTSSMCKALTHKYTINITPEDNGARTFGFNKGKPKVNNQNLKNTGPSFEKMLANMDANDDGKVSKSEAKGKLKENFDKRDKNKDGYITEDELTRRNR